MLTGWGMTAFRIEPKNRLLSGSTTRDSVNPKSLIFDALSGQANSHRLLQRAISFFFCESAIAALASLQARHCTLHYGTLRIVASLLQAAELLTWGGNSRTCPNRATRLQRAATQSECSPPKNKYHYAHPVSIIIAHQTLPGLLVPDINATRLTALLMRPDDSLT